MNDNRKEYINELLQSVRQLEEEIKKADMEETLSFSFFKESFARIQLINGLLHKLQSMQIEEMKSQLQKLAIVLSDKEAGKADDSLTEESVEGKKDAEDNAPEPTSKSIGIKLPEYKNPLADKPLHNGTPVADLIPPIPSASTPDPLHHEKQSTIRSLNDAIQAPPSLLDFKKRISLNDRFFFQRELFHNNREEMNNMMVKLGAFNSHEEAVQYLRVHTNWNFDEPVVQDFLSVIKKGYV